MATEHAPPAPEEPQRRDPAQIMSICFAGLALAVAVGQFPKIVSKATNDIRGGLPERHVREETPLQALDLPTEVGVGAAALIPEDATYTLIVGANAPLSETQKIGLPDVLHYWLLPRRWVGDISRASWVIAYGTPTETIDASFARQIEVSPGVVVAEVMR